MKIFALASSLLSMVCGRSSMSKTLTSLTDLDHEFRSRAKLFLNSEQREQFNTQMDHIVEMFHAHDKDNSIMCYNKGAHIDNGQIESSDSVLEYASALTKLIDSAFGECENYIDIAGRAAELRWSLLEDPNDEDTY
jgi:hypothetical protein